MKTLDRILTKRCRTTAAVIRWRPYCLECQTRLPIANVLRSRNRYTACDSCDGWEHVMRRQPDPHR